MEMLGCFFPFFSQISQELTRTSLLPHFNLLREEVECVLADKGNSLLQDEVSEGFKAKSTICEEEIVILFQNALGLGRLDCP